MAACSSEADLAVGANNEPAADAGAVQFSAYTARSTRAGEPATTDPIVEVAGLANAGGFGVFAYEQGTLDYSTYSTTATYPNFFYNQQVWGYETSGTKKIDFETGATVNWEYAPIKYYSNNAGAKHTFFAYAPYSDGVEPVFNIGSAPQIRHSASQDFDLMWAEPAMNREKPGVTESIMFNFRHALSKVTFHIVPFIDVVHGTGSHVIGQTLAEGATVSVRGLRFVGVVPATALLNIGNGEWTIETSREGWFVPDATTAHWTGSSAPLARVDLAPIKFIPTDNLKIEISYEVTATDPATGKVESRILNKVTSLEKFTLEAGKAYNFYLDLGLTSVKFNAMVDPWTNAPTQIIDLPNNHGFNIIPYVNFTGATPSLTEVPNSGTIYDITDATGTPTHGDGYYYSEKDNCLYDYGVTTAATWTKATTAARYYDSTRKMYFDVATTTGKTVRYAVEYACVDGTFYHELTSFGATPPMPVYSLNVNNEGKIQTGADASLPASWTVPTEDAFYTLTYDNNTADVADDVTYLYKWKSNNYPGFSALPSADKLSMNQAASDPSPATEGDTYWKTGEHRVRKYTSSTWGDDTSADYDNKYIYEAGTWYKVTNGAGTAVTVIYFNDGNYYTDSAFTIPASLTAGTAYVINGFIYLKK